MTGLAFVFFFFVGVALGLIVAGLCRMAGLGEDDPTEEFVEALHKQAAQRRAEATAAPVLALRKSQHLQD